MLLLEDKDVYLNIKLLRSSGFGDGDKNNLNTV